MDTELMTQTTCPIDMLEEHGLNAADILGSARGKWKYMAMDKDGEWYLYTRKPHREGEVWCLSYPLAGEALWISRMLDIKPAEDWKTSLLEAIG